MNDGLTAIIIDDDKDVCEIFAEFLEILNIKVVGIAHDGNQGFRTFQNTLPDIVFLDLMMPEYDGIYALERIRMMSQNAFVTIVTAEGRFDVIEKIKHLNPDKIISKPFAIESIREAIGKIRTVV